MGVYNPKRRTKDGTEEVKFPISSISGLEPTEDDEGKVLTVVNGNPTWVGKYSEGLDFYHSASGEVICTGIGTCADTDIIIPSEHLGEPVTIIGGEAFAQTNITSVVIPNSVTSVESGAFAYCPYLKSVIIPNSVTTIEEYAFYHSDSLTIYCEAKSQPSGWNASWNVDGFPVVWGYASDFISASNKYQTKTDETLATTDKTVVGAINEVNGKTVDKIANFYFYSGTTTVEEPNGEGIRWKNDEVEIEFQGGKFAHSSVNSIVPIVAGENVTFETDADNKVVKINGQAGVDKIYTLDTWYGSSSNVYYNDNSGVSWNDEFAFYDDSDNEITTGNITQKIPIVAGENVTFENDGYKVKINASGGGGSSIRTLIGSEGLEYTKSKDGTYAICVGLGTCTDSNIKIASHYGGLPVEEIANEAFSGAHFDIKRIVSITVPNSVKTIGTYFVEYCANLRSVFIPKSVTFIDEFAFIIKDAPTYIYFEADSEPSEWDKNWMGDLTKENLIWGYDYPYDKNGNVEMPIIRFTGARDTDCSMILSENNPITLTVEVIGGGALQVGDKLQLCARRTSWYRREDDSHFKKQKLRRREEYTITADDLQRRFLSVSLGDNSSGASWLYKNDRTSCESLTLSPVYLRIKRVTKLSYQGAEADAIFSNVVTVWKTYARNGFISFK